MSVTYRRDESIAVITLDDGKVNVLGPVMLAAINDALDQADSDGAGAVVIAGNHRVFSGGFDLKVFQSGDVQASIDMLRAGFTLSHRLLSFPSPVVAACTGHAIAMGSFLAGSTDHRIAAPGYTFQANEVVNGMVLPYAALEIMKLRLTPSAYQQAVGLAKPSAGEAALAAGWVDEIVAPERVLDRAIEAAREFAALPAQAHFGCKMRGREQALEAIKTSTANVDTEFGLA